MKTNENEERALAIRELSHEELLGVEGAGIEEAITIPIMWFPVFKMPEGGEPMGPAPRRR